MEIHPDALKKIEAQQEADRNRLTSSTCWGLLTGGSTWSASCYLEGTIFASPIVLVPVSIACCLLGCGSAYYLEGREDDDKYEISR